MKSRGILALALVVLLIGLTLKAGKHLEPKEAESYTPKRVYAIVDLSATLQERVSVMRFGPTDAARIYGYSLFGADLAFKESKGDSKIAAVAGSTIAERLVPALVMGREMQAYRERRGVVKGSLEEKSGLAIAEKVIKIAESDGYNPKVDVKEIDLEVNKFEGDMAWRPTGTGDGPLDPQFIRVQSLGNDIEACKPRIPTKEEVLAEGEAMYKNFRASDAVGLDVLWWLAGTGTSTPSGYWLRITNNLIRNSMMSEDKASDLIGKIAVAEFDAAILIWRYKYAVNLIRPESLWQNLYGAPLNKLPRDTPNHPSFPSGHSGFSSAAAGVIINTVGNVPLSDQLPPDLYAKAWVRSWPTPRDAVNEASLSRVHAGFHYPLDTKAGESIGYCIGDKISKNYNNLVERVVKNER